MSYGSFMVYPHLGDVLYANEVENDAGQLKKEWVLAESDKPINFVQIPAPHRTFPKFNAEFISTVYIPVLRSQGSWLRSDTSAASLRLSNIRNRRGELISDQDFDVIDVRPLTFPFMSKFQIYSLEVRAVIDV